MNYYNFHIGDFNNATRHLTRSERSIYRDLIDMYYDKEQAIDASNFDLLARRLLCRSDEEKVDLQFVLDEFFKLENDGLYHLSRCDEEIAAYHEKVENASKAGRASAAKRSEKSGTLEKQQDNEQATVIEHTFNSRSTVVQQSLNDRSTNQEPITNNQEPILNTHSSACEEKNSLDEILNLWNPDLKMVNDWLRRAGASPFSQKQFDEFKPAFLNHYAPQLQNGLLKPDKLFGKLVTWVKRDFKTYSSKSIDKPSEKPRHKYGTGVVTAGSNEHDFVDLNEVSYV